MEQVSLPVAQPEKPESLAVRALLDTLAANRDDLQYTVELRDATAEKLRVLNTNLHRLTETNKAIMTAVAQLRKIEES